LRLQERLQSVVLMPRVRGDEVTYVMELTVKMPTAPSAMEAPSDPALVSCGGPLFGLPQTTFRAIVSASRGSATVRVLRPKRPP
jgi:hypothetical protein